MKSLLSTVICFVFTGFAMAQGRQGNDAAKSTEPKIIPGQYIVILKESAALPVIKQQKQNKDREQKERDNEPARRANLNKVQEIYTKHKIKETGILAKYGDVLVGFSAKLSDTEIIEVKSDPDVEAVYPDYEVSLNGEDKPQGAIMKGADMNGAQSTPCGVNVIGGSADGSTKTNLIWLLDTGIDPNHEDLNVNTNSKFAISFVLGETIIDGNGHGTHCAGIAAAKNNDKGIIGASAGARVVPVKVLANSGLGSFSNILSGLNHISKLDAPGDVVTMSLGTYPINDCSRFNTGVESAINNLSKTGTYVCIAAGNDGDCAGATRSFPGCLNGKKIITVGAITCEGACAGYSNFNSNVVDFVAVGSDVLSTYKDNTYTVLSGTSMAAPLIAGLIHSIGGLPNSSGTTPCCGSSYKKAAR